MTLQLDERQRAMLAEMGVRLFWPETPAPVRPRAEAAVAAAGAPSAPPVVAARVAAPLPAARAPVPAPSVVAVRAPGPVDGMDWAALGEAVRACEGCKLCGGRTQAVLGVGPAQADWMIVGDPPGEHEDRAGEPFVDQPGRLLDNMLAALGLNRRQHVYISNVLKCRPAGDRNPEPDELAQCEPFLRRQVALVQPRVILAMGRFSAQVLLQSNEPIGRLRGRAHAYHGVPVVVTFHPAYLLRNLPDKAKAWADLCLARSLLAP